MTTEKARATRVAVTVRKSYAGSQSASRSRGIAELVLRPAERVPCRDLGVDVVLVSG
jgi:hypothetical protein